MVNLNAEIVAIGTEILLGELTDTNSVYLARTLRDLGINLYFKTAVGDNEGRIETALRIALDRADVIITCGGLGPTIDDMTRQAVAAATDRGLAFHQHLLDAIAARFQSFRVQMTDNNRRQAYIPEGAVVIENPVGTAPAFAVELGHKSIICLPGVPREMKFLMTEKVIPYLRQRYGLAAEIIKARTLKVAGVGESALDEIIGAELLNSANPSIGLAAHSGQVDVRVTAKADNPELADSLMAPMLASLHERIGKYVYGYDADRLENALSASLRKAGLTLITAEAGIRTQLQSLLTAACAPSQTLHIWRETLNEMMQELHIDEATPLREAAESAAKKLAVAHNAASIVVISLPGGEMDNADRDERTAVAACLDNRVASRSYGFGAASEPAQVWIVTWTMAALWRMLRDRDEA